MSGMVNLHEKKGILLILTSFNNEVTVSDYIASDDMIIKEHLFRRDTEGIDSYLII